MKFIHLIICSIILISGCVSEIEFKNEENAYIAVSGVITNNFQKNILTVNRINGVTGEIEKLKAKGSYFEDGVYAGPLPQFNPGELVFPIDFRVKEGVSYHVEIVLEEDSSIYQSIPQFIKPPIRMDSASIEVNKRFDGTSTNGTVRDARYVDFFVHITIPSDRTENQYYRWQVDEVWSFEEVPNPDNPDDRVKTCYPIKDVIYHPSKILSSENLQAGEAAVRLVSREIDESFLFKHFFNAYLHTIDEQVFTMYEQAEQLIQNSGTLYDVVPAAVKGNMLNINDETEQVLGIVEFAQVDTLRFSVFEYDIKTQITNTCLVADPCRTFAFQGGLVSRPCKCHDCELVYGTVSLIKPDYWDE